MYHNFHSSVERHLDCLHFLGIVNKAAISIVKQASIEWEVKYFETVTRSALSDSRGRIYF